MATSSHSDDDLFLSDVHIEERRPDSQGGLGHESDVSAKRVSAFIGLK